MAGQSAGQRRQADLEAARQAVKEIGNVGLNSITTGVPHYSKKHGRHIDVYGITKRQDGKLEPNHDLWHAKP